jgi:hypothetical protein
MVLYSKYISAIDYKQTNRVKIILFHQLKFKLQGTKRRWE